VRVLVARAVEPQVAVFLQAVRVGEDHDAILEGSEPELATILHHDAGVTDGATPVKEAELPIDHEEVEPLLLLCELPECGLLGDAFPQVLRAELVLDVVDELLATLHPELAEHDLYRLAVGRGDLLPGRDDELALGTIQHREIRQHFVGVADALEDLTEAIRLLGDRTGLTVPREVSVARFDLLVGELLWGRELSEHRPEVLLEQLLACRTAHDNPLSRLLAEAELVEHCLEGDLAEPLDLTLLTRRDRIDHHPPLVDAEARDARSRQLVSRTRQVC